jgi:hypothetical protein
LNTFDAGHRRDKIQEIVHIGGSGNKWYSKTFGITSTDPVTATKLGELIDADPNIKNELRKLFGIKQRKVFQPGVSYDKQLASLVSAVEAEITK